MTRTRLVLCLALIGAMGACGGRSGLRAAGGDGGHGDGSATSDGRLDGGLDGRGLDGRLDGLGSDVRIGDGGATDIRVVDGNLDIRIPDGGLDVRPPDSTLADVRLPDGGSADVRDVPAPDVPASDVLRTDAPSDVQRDTGNVDSVAVTLSSIELSPANPRVTLRLSLSVKVTAVYSNGTTEDVSSSATITSGSTSILTVTGSTLNGVAVGTSTVTATYQGKTASTTATVVDVPLSTISIAAVAPIPVGQKANLIATGVFADGYKQDVTLQATWTTSSAATATVSDSGATKGQVTGVVPGTATITASIQTSVSGTSTTISGKVDVEVSPKKITNIAVTPTAPTMHRGETQPFMATATYDDSSVGDVTTQATWTVGDGNILSVATSGASIGSVTAKLVGQTTVTATYAGASGSTTVLVIAPTLRSIALTPSSATVASHGGTQSFVATGSYADGTTAILTDSVTWSSSDSTILTVSNSVGTRGVATGVVAGTATVQATLDGVVGSANVTVKDIKLLSIAIAPASLSVPAGVTSKLTATGTYDDTSTKDVTADATWVSADPTIATVGNTGATAGQVTGVKANNSTTVTATLNGITSPAVTVTVTTATLASIAVAPATANVTAGKTQAFTATGTYSDKTTIDITASVTWSSSAINIAEVSNAAGSNGLATSLRQGTTTITATLNGMTGTATLTVGAPALVSISIAPTTASRDVGQTQGYTVTAVYQNGTTSTNLTGVNWSSSLTTVATITANTGRGGGTGATATAVAAGQTTITATYQGFSDTSILNVTKVPVLVGVRIDPASASLKVDGQANFTLYGNYDDGTSTQLTTGITWTITDGAVASLSGGFGGGVTVTARGAGSATLNAAYTTSSGASYADKAIVTVTAAPTLTGLYIEPASATVRVNGTQQFRAYAKYSDGTSSDVTGTASWTTSDGTLATVSNAGGRGGRGAVAGAGGLATGIAKSTSAGVTITATYSTFSATATLIVTAAVPTSLVVTPATATIKLNATQNFQSFLIYDDGTSLDVTSTASWTSSDANVAVLSVAGGGRGGGPGPVGGLVGGGTATGVGIGSATVTAQYTTDTGAILSDTATLTVTDPPILSLELSPTTPSVYLSSNPNQQFTATVIYTDYTTRTVTASATWSSSAPTVAVIGTAGGTAGRATGLVAGTSTITASYAGFSASTVLTVGDRKVTSLQVTPTNPTTYLGLNQAFVATAIYDTGSPGAVTGAATWTTSDDTVASVGTSGGSAGLASPIKKGTTTIKATYQGVSGTSVLTVSDATLSSIAITPSPLNVAVGGRQQLTATGTYSDTQTRDLTNNVTWLSSSDAVATVSNASPRGLLTGVSANSVTVSAKFQGVTGTLTGTIGSAPSVDAGAATD